jgi:hypothetical protein
MRLLISILGMASGFAVVIVALLLNPLAPVSMQLADTEVYDLSPLEFHGAELDDVMLMNLPLRASGTPFAADNMTHSNGSIVVLKDSSGKAVALGTRLVMAGDDSDLLGARLSVQTYTNIFWPNRGSFIMYGQENRWPVLRSHILPGGANGDDESWSVSVAPVDGSQTGMIGGSGALESIGGRYSEGLQLNPSGDGTFVGQVSLETSVR